MNMSKNPMILHDSGLPQEVGQGRHVAIQTLTPRQLEVLTVIAEGKSNKQAAQILSISPETVRRHIIDARVRLHLENRIQLIVAFAKWQAVEGIEQ